MPIKKFNQLIKESIVEESGKFVVECTLNENEIEIEDGGQAKIFSCCGEDDQDSGMFVKIQSWSEDGQHPEFDSFIGKKVRITIETID